MDEFYKIGNIIFNYKKSSLLLNDKSVHLTKKECELLKLLVANKNNLLTREEALVAIWGRNDYFYGRSMDVYLSKLRKHLNSENNISIINVHGKGFILEIKS